MQPPVGDRQDEQVDAVMRATRVVLGITAQSIAEVEGVVSLAQLRVLVFVASHGPQSVSAVALDLGVHRSNATRTCDRLVRAGLLDRREDPADRRFLQLDLTAQGRRLVERVMVHRRRAIASVMAELPAATRRELAASLEAFTQAGGDLVRDDPRYVLGRHG